MTDEDKTPMAEQDQAAFRAELAKHAPSQFNSDSIRTEFSVQALSESGMEKARRIGVMFTAALNLVESSGVKGRELSLVTTKLQEASLFANLAISADPVNQK